MEYDKVYRFLVKELVCVFGLHLSRIKCLAELILCLVKVRSCNLVQLSRVFNGSASCDSSYKRLKRFVKEVRFDQAVLAPFLVRLMDLQSKSSWTLLLDRTNWRLGEIHVSLLHLSVYCCGQKIGIPLFWLFLTGKKQGNSGFANQKKLIERFISVFGVERIEVMLGDREFISQSWITYLKEQKIPYIMRMREQAGFISNSKGYMVKPEFLFRDLRPGEQRNLGKRKIAKTNDMISHISALRNKKGELVVLMHSKNLKDVPELYKNRWQIEVMFRCFKSGGFDMEATHVTLPERIETIAAVIAIAFCIAYKTGLYQAEHDPPPILKHGRKSISVFRIGLDKIQHSIFNIKQKYQEIIKILRVIFTKNNELQRL